MTMSRGTRSRSIQMPLLVRVRTGRAAARSRALLLCQAVGHRPRPRLRGRSAPWRRRARRSPGARRPGPRPTRRPDRATTRAGEDVDAPVEPQRRKRHARAEQDGGRAGGEVEQPGQRLVGESGPGDEHEVLIGQHVLGGEVGRSPSCGSRSSTVSRQRSRPSSASRGSGRRRRRSCRPWTRGARRTRPRTSRPPAACSANRPPGPGCCRRS